MNIGAAQIDITPDFEVELSGFAAREQPCIGVREPIFARAIYLDDGAEKLLWIACDLIALEQDFVDGFRDWAKRELHLAPQQVLLCCTHTHNAPATIHLNAAGQYSGRYVRFLRVKLEAAAREAIQETVPCDILAGSAPLTLSIDRRCRPSAHVDHTVWAIGMRQRGSETFSAVIINYAMHPVALGHVERCISPDWCGAASEGLSSNLDGTPHVLVTNGAAGNLNPPMENTAEDVVRGYGAAVAEAAVRALATAKPQAVALRVRSVTVRIPLDVLDDRGIDAAADAFLASIGPDHKWAVPINGAVSTWRHATKQTIAAGGGREVPIEVQAIRIGDVTIVAINGEMFSRFTEMLRQRTTANLFVVGYANAAFGYIPTREAYAEGGYEADQAHFFYNSFRPRVGTLEMLVDRAAELINTF